MMTTQPMKSIKTEIGAKHLVAGNNAHEKRMDELASVFRCNVGRASNEVPRTLSFTLSLFL